MADTEETLQEFISIVDGAKDYEVEIFLDAEGGDGHGRNSNMNFVEVNFASTDQSCLLDVKKLGSKIFDMPSLTSKGRTFGQILADEKTPIVWFDVRADSDSIFGHFKVHVEAVIDLQLMEAATRTSSRQRLQTLDRCIENFPESTLPYPGFRAWNNIGCASKVACSGPDKYGAFDIRPIPKELEEYSVNDVSLMPLTSIHLLF